MFVSFPKILKYFAIFTNSYTWLSSIASKPYPQICLDLCNPHYRTVCEAKGQARLEHSWNGNIPELESRSGLVRVGGGDRRGGCGYERATEGVLVVEPRRHRDVVVDTPIYRRQVMQNTEQHGENRGRGGQIRTGRRCRRHGCDVAPCEMLPPGELCKGYICLHGDLPVSSSVNPHADRCVQRATSGV